MMTKKEHAASDAVLLKNAELRQQYQGIEFLSDPSNYSMADEWFDIVSPDHFWLKWRLEILKKILPVHYDWGTVLDIGCGNGMVGEQIEKYYGCKTCGCDLNLTALRMVPGGRRRLCFYNIHEQHKEFEKAFSTILLMDVLEHVDDGVEFLRSVSFHMKPEGRLIINVPAIQMFYSKYDKVAGHIKRYSMDSLTQELELAGFQIEKAVYWGMSLIPLLLVRKVILNFYSDDKVIAVGFRPVSSFVNKALDLVGRLERRIFSAVLIGTSLMIVAKKKK